MIHKDILPIVSNSGRVLKERPFRVSDHLSGEPHPEDHVDHSGAHVPIDSRSFFDPIDPTSLHNSHWWFKDSPSRKGAPPPDDE